VPDEVELDVSVEDAGALGAPMISWWWEGTSLHKDLNTGGLLPMPKLLENRQDSMEPHRRSTRDDLVLGPELAARGFRLLR
jgi:hypothetical protein